MRARKNAVNSGHNIPPATPKGSAPTHAKNPGVKSKFNVRLRPN